MARKRVKKVDKVEEVDGNVSEDVTEVVAEDEPAPLETVGEALTHLQRNHRRNQFGRKQKAKDS